MAFTARTKIVKLKGHPITTFEDTVAEQLFELQTNSTSDYLKTELKPLFFHAAKEFDVSEGKKVVVIWYPYRLMKEFKRTHTLLTRELEKKFSGKTVILVAERTILPKGQQKQKRPRSRTIKAVHDAILDDIVYPSTIVGKRTRVRLDGTKIIKVLLDPKENKDHEMEGKLDTYSAIYKRLTGKRAEFLFADYKI
eukprot:TRINITY_DN384_c0_g1_i2.p1 TRINITY_DN384_c0_g1~~TRINITY_DN384_c0_g1_i2.p1  ORF type:complete len:195 (+),score=35.54 TRINITY_DN384_c0_g1_i2:86-670(+)